MGTYIKRYPRRKHFKFYTRLCNQCNEYYKFECNELRSRPKGSFTCPECKKRIHREGLDLFKIKNKNRWDRKILELLKNKQKKLTMFQLSNELACSNGSSFYKRVKSLSLEGKVKLSKGQGDIIGKYCTVVEIVTPQK